MAVTLNLEDLADLLDGHRQEHEPDTGASRCSCGRWRGPYTRHAAGGTRFADHLSGIVMQWMTEAAR